MSLSGVLALAAIVRLLWLFWLPVVPESDFATFVDMATKIAHGVWSPEEYGWVYQGPGYPVLLAPLIALGGGLDAIRIANVVAQLAMVSGVWWLGRRFFGLRGATIAGASAAILPGMWSYVPLVAAESAAMLLLTVVAISLRTRIARWPSMVAGVLVTMLAFTRPSFLPFVLLVAIAVVFLGRERMWLSLLWFGAGAIMVATPFVALNVANDGPLLPAGAAGWQTWLVNNEHATGGWFDAYAEDSYPFTGLLGDSETRAAQSKLGVQFIVANPAAAAYGLTQRYRTNWQSDTMGINWTFDRAPVGWQARVPFAGYLNDVAQFLYVLTLGLAAVGAIRHRARADLLLPIVLPLGYAIAILSVAEGNARYHAMFLPLICVMAGGAFVPARARQDPVVGVSPPHGLRARIAGNMPSWSGHWSRNVALITAFVLAGGLCLWLFGSAALVQWRQVNQTLPPCLLAVVVLAPTAGCGAFLVSRRWQHIVRAAQQPSRRWLGYAALGMVVCLIPIWSTVSTIERTLAELSAVDVGGWERTFVTTSGEEKALPLLLEDSAAGRGPRAVSFPDAALLPFDSTPQPGDVVKLRRTLKHLEVGKEYVFYLQVYDPGTDGDAGERLAIELNGAVSWERPAGRTDPGGWQYVRIAWVADAETLTIVASREAGQHYRADLTAIPKVRTLHLYPEY